MNTCYIMAAGDFKSSLFMPESGDYVIAADAGYLYLKELGIKPDLIIGDFDSMEKVPEGDNIKLFPVMKDDTDTILAIRAGLDKGFKQFRIFGALGGNRFDHTVSNIQSLAFLNSHGAFGMLIGEHENIVIITDGEYIFPDDSIGTVSVFAFGGKAKGVSNEGLLFPLNNAELSTDYPLGVSNKFIGKSAKVSVKEGSLLIIWNC